jgi:hypothetical protein
MDLALLLKVKDCTVSNVAANAFEKDEASAVIVKAVHDYLLFQALSQGVSVIACARCQEPLTDGVDIIVEHSTALNELVAALIHPGCADALRSAGLLNADSREMRGQ